MSAQFASVCYPNSNLNLDNPKAHLSMELSMQTYSWPFVSGSCGCSWESVGMRTWACVTSGTVVQGSQAQSACDHTHMMTYCETNTKQSTGSGQWEDPKRKLLFPGTHVVRIEWFGEGLAKARLLRLVCGMSIWMPLSPIVHRERQKERS